MSIKETSYEQAYAINAFNKVLIEDILSTIPSSDGSAIDGETDIGLGGQGICGKIPIDGEIDIYETYGNPEIALGIQEIAERNGADKKVVKKRSWAKYVLTVIASALLARYLYVKK